MMDLGSGCLIDLSPYGLSEEITVQEVLSKGVDVSRFSGDKLLGGRAGRNYRRQNRFLEKMRTNPLARALRMDKAHLGGIGSHPLEYTRPEGPAAGIPTLDMITKSPEKLC